VLGILGVPSIQHGNVIEVSTGMVGINDACSGIRSFQSSLMIALFLGEFYMFRWPRRLLLVPLGFLIAMALNLCRASLLTGIAATKGVAAIAQYHDEAGLMILLVCTALLWGAAWLMNWRKPAPVAPEPAKAGAGNPVTTEPGSWRRLNRLAVILIVWLVLVETGVALWYHLREAKIQPGPDWTVVMPADNPGFAELPLTPEEHTLLRFDDGKKAQWEDPVGTLWQGFYFNWQPGRVAGYLAKRHTPDICLTATGLKMTQEPKLEVITVQGVALPMRHYVFESPEGQLQVYQCHWEAGLGQEMFTAEESSRFNLIRGVWAGRGNQGQKVLEMVLIGNDNPEYARQALIAQLEKMIRVAEPANKSSPPKP
jgi:exosortase/archaeosortase family protein